MRLEESCHCGAVTFRLESAHPHPFASAIDSELPRPPERTHLMHDCKASWVDTRHDPQDKLFKIYPEESIAAWHERLGLER